jgi:hypothetical protein
VPLKVGQITTKGGEVAIFFDEFDWDINCPRIYIDIYATRMAEDFDLGPEIAAMIASEMKKQLEKAQAAVAAGELVPSPTPRPRSGGSSSKAHMLPVVLRGKDAQKVINKKKAASKVHQATNGGMQAAADGDGNGPQGPEPTLGSPGGLKTESMDVT